MGWHCCSSFGWADRVGAEIGSPAPTQLSAHPASHGGTAWAEAGDSGRVGGPVAQCQVAEWETGVCCSIVVCSSSRRMWESRVLVFQLGRNVCDWVRRSPAGRWPRKVAFLVAVAGGPRKVALRVRIPPI